MTGSIWSFVGGCHFRHWWIHCRLWLMALKPRSEEQERSAGDENSRSGSKE
jgi:hypothetical protein